MSPPPPLSPALQGLSFDKKETSHQVVTVCRSRGGPRQGSWLCWKGQKAVRASPNEDYRGRWVEKGKEAHRGKVSQNGERLCMARLLRWGQGYGVRSGQQGPDLGRLVIPGGEGSC